MQIALLGGIGLGSLLALLVIFLLAKQFLPAYVAEKGKNLATKEDIAAITHEVERVRTQYAAVLESLKATNSLRMAAVDKRLQAHQEAFTYWRLLMSRMHTDDIGSAVISCQSWWEKNCLYLEPDVRTAFVNAHSAASNHRQLLRGHNTEPALIDESWRLITSFPNILFEAIKLPALSQAEAEALSLTIQKSKSHSG